MTHDMTYEEVFIIRMCACVTLSVCVARRASTDLSLLHQTTLIIAQRCLDMCSGMSLLL